MSYRLNRLALIVACAALAACSKSGGGAAPGAGGRVNSWTIPHVLRFSTAEDISTLNPHLSQQGTLSYMSSMTMAWLIKFDEKNLPYGELATEVPTKENGGVSADGLTITYHLRKNVKWSDGAPFNADDVVFSIKTVQNPANNEVSRSGWDLIDKIDEPDKYTVRLHLRKPYSPFVVTFFSSAGANPCVLPKHILGKLATINNAPYNALPVGIGPFKYTKWLRSQKVVMVANADYFRGLPKLHEVDYEIIPNRDTVQTQLEAHGLDMWYRVPGLYFTRLEHLPGFATIRQPGFGFNHLDFNTSHAAVSDPAVRQALEYATDRVTMRAKIGHGFGILQEEPAPPVASYFDPALAKIKPFDLAKANQLLDGAGWKRGADGIRAKNGLKLSLDFATNTGSQDTDNLIELLRTWWKQAGVAIDVHHYNSALLFAPLSQGGILYAGKFDVLYINWGLDPLGDFSNLYACDQIPPNGQNDLHWCNRRASAAMRDFYAQYSIDGRTKDDAIVMEELQRDTPTIVTSLPEDTFVYNKDLKNFHPGSALPFDNMMNVDI
ncbi:MAG TPA: peptide ABC transporter substrate-binding protein [Candidatus Baltobacteraceae bacterium]|jgi:peptide/nickel transport system substrate-binding protein